MGDHVAYVSDKDRFLSEGYLLLRYTLGSSLDFLLKKQDWRVSDSFKTSIWTEGHKMEEGVKGKKDWGKRAALQARRK
jgi:hypothetical protein